MCGPPYVVLKGDGKGMRVSLEGTSKHLPDIQGVGSKGMDTSIKGILKGLARDKTGTGPGPL